MGVLRLYYWPGLPGRGEPVRLVLEQAAVPYVDVGRLPASEGGGPRGVAAVLDGRLGGLRPLAPPVLQDGDRVISQSANICAYLAKRHGLVSAEAELDANQLQLVLADLVGEAHDTHHPVATGLYYEDQKGEALRAAEHFRDVRMPKFLAYLEDVRRGPWLLGAELTYVDLTLAWVLAGLEFAFPKACGRLEFPGLTEVADQVAALPRIAAYRASERCVPFSKDGIFRAYPELDG